MGCGLYKLDRIRELDYWAGMSHQCTCIWLMPHGLMNPPLSVAAAQKRGDGPGLRRRHQGHEAQRKAPAPARGLHP